ncbi:FixH family protein [Polaribacter gangjinensis]|uniref:Cytochrome C oxidase Cbb3 n=1 Tax=Polaribacter gangjinensis TaxID=574710 RepID=A0A2S7W9C1_9FLAO|nr:FixH family protein [Polaribacter gangjinensis]PQJ74235.1 cytochrome C oxidase Cbb3 [Polaribacter gangjinensis]
MKFNWGTGIVIAFVAFIGFILYFVITMSIDKEYSHDLVTEGYYQKELEFQDRINATENSKDFEDELKVIKYDEGLFVFFPENLDYKKIKGKVFLYRPSNKQLDFEVPISISKNYLLVPENRLVDGRWNIAVEWEYENKKYLTEEALNF